MQTAELLRSTFLESDLETDLQRARWLANWLDAKFNVLGLRFGLQGIVGLVPVVGDTVTTAAGVFPIFVAWRHKLGLGVQAAMAANLAIEWTLGLTPFVGDVADVWYKANLRNLTLLEKAAAKSSQKENLT